LRGKQLAVWFRRQVPLECFVADCVALGRLVVDFAAVSARLVVEVDGGYHARCRASDARRNRALARPGYRVLRLNAALVLQ
jgi:very-short-patch-repair endonuclease